MNRREVQAVAETTAGIHVMFIDVLDDDGASAVGQVFLEPTDTRGPRQPARHELGTTDTLRALWASPSGALWVGSADGFVATTATVPWTTPVAPDYRAFVGPPWHVTALPLMRGNGLRPNIDLLWGTADDDVYVGAYGGHIYHWNGSDWTQSFEGAGGAGAAIRAFGGPARGEVYAVGVDRRLLRHDGQRWIAMAVPPPAGQRENLTGVACLDGGVYISSALGSDEGRLLHGGADGFVEVARCRMPLVGMAALGERLLFVTGDGVATYEGDDIRMIKSFPTNAIYPGIGRVFVLQPAPERPMFAEYEPRHPQAPWWRLVY